MKRKKATPKAIRVPSKLAMTVGKNRTPIEPEYGEKFAHTGIFVFSPYAAHSGL
jgi:hypothetical protein